MECEDEDEERRMLVNQLSSSGKTASSMEIPISESEGLRYYFFLFCYFIFQNGY